MLASAMDPSTLAHTYITDQGMFKPAPQPPRKAPTAPKHPRLPAFALLTAEDEEEQLVRSLQAGQDIDMRAEEFRSQNAAHGLREEDVDIALRQWFREQKHFQENITLRRQHARVLRQLSHIQRHMSEKKQQQAVQKQRSRTATKVHSQNPRKKPKAAKRVPV